MLGPALGEHIFLFRREDRKLLDLSQIAVEPASPPAAGIVAIFLPLAINSSISP
jgi:hypothetical protein